MRRRVGGARCGACGLGFANPAPGRFGQPSGPTTRVCLQWLDAGVNDGGESRMATWGSFPRSLPGSTAPRYDKRHSGAPGGERAG